MDRLKDKKMPVTIHKMKGEEFPPAIQKKFNVKPKQILTVTVETADDFGNELLQAFEEVKAHRKGEIDLPTYDDFVKELNNGV